MKKKCDKCKKLFRNLIQFKGKFYCSNCYKTVTTMIPKGFTLQQALSKVYNIKKEIYNGQVQATKINPPHVLIGKKVKFVLVK